ncbi:hypothetical protein NC653_007295 [Populus alba x Populus x berolinensis]|uniref:Uncharacterized protein n=1 Tax=Populus alba x Populus x berolinensis TaxID=444605 RepID=A0AAD6RGQ7_9ROSI|nr:hypothetical protein NC653_007295 [Populus alba x Populus x berolinensis]
MENNSIVSVENLNNVANWVSATVISAFFSSLERFSCVNVATMNPDDDDDEAQDRPLALSTNQHLQHNDVANLPGFCVNCLHFMEMLPALVDPRTGMRKIIDMFSSRMMRRRNGYKVGKLVLLLRGMSYLCAFITVWVFLVLCS